MSFYETNADQLHAVNLLDTCNGYCIPVELLFASFSQVFFLTFQSSNAHILITEWRTAGPQALEFVKRLNHTSYAIMNYKWFRYYSVLAVLVILAR